MTIATISGTITNTVTAGTGNYAATLTITNTGAIDNLYGVDLPAGGTLVNDGVIISSTDGVAARFGGSLINNGTIIANQGVDGTGAEPIRNTGLIYGTLTGVVDVVSYLYNSGSIGAGQRGVMALGTLTNTGSISGGTSGVALSSGLVRNAGDIFGGRAGVYVYGAGAQLVTDGSIGGGSYAIDVTAGSFALTLLPGAEFSGRIEDTAADGTLVLGGSTAGTLDIASFSGFSTIDFTSGWVLEGTAAQLAAGQTIDGFGQGDTIILDGFSATSNTYISGTGLVLSNATASETLHLSGLDAHQLNMVAGSGGTTIVAPVSTISTDISPPIALGQGGYATSLTITSTGTLSNNPNYDFPGIIGTGTVTNAGLIETEFNGISLVSGVVIDSGTISVKLGAIYAQSSLTLILEPGAVFSGIDGATVTDEANNGLLILGAGSSHLYLDGPNSFSGFSQFSFAPNAAWELEGSVSKLATGETISGFATGDTLLLDQFAATSSSYISGIGLVLSNATGSETLAIAAPPHGFHVATQYADTEITAACFCRGTRIGTPGGGVAVETLAIGIAVTTDLGPATIKWIGRRDYDGGFIAGNHLALPVKIRRHALGFNVPSRDVYLSPDHGVCEGGVFVPAWRLVNGVSVTQAASVERVAYYHIELEKPAVIFAETMPVESFVDADCRHRFQNAAEYDLLYPEPAAPQHHARPRVEDGFLLQRIRQRINARAGLAPMVQGFGPLRGCIDETTPRLRGWAQDSAAPENPVLLEILHDGAVISTLLANTYRPDLRKAGLGSGCHAFDLPLPPLPGRITLRRAGDGASIATPQTRAA